MNAPPTSGLPAPGDRIAGKYDVVRVIGEGGMGIVYEVVHARLQQRAAIKMLQPRVQAIGEVAARFEREARAACRLRSRHAVRITDVDHDAAGRAYMVMEFLAGNDLSQELLMRGRLPVAEAVDVVLQACAAMAEAHTSGVVHRDLKPSNLFLVPEEGERIVKVLDFGISKLTTEGEAAVTSTFATMGTPLYMSPEQIRSTKNVDGRTDIWSLGVILFEAIGGERPFQGTTMTAAAAAIVADEPVSLRALAPDVPEALEGVVAKALAKRAEDRFADVRAFAEALAPFGSGRTALRGLDAAPVRNASAGAAAPVLAREPSTPSFVHAPTMAHPAVASGQSPLARTVDAAVASSNRSGAAALGDPAVSTEAGWSNPKGSGAGAGRLTKLLAAAAALVVVLGAAYGFRATRPRPTALPDLPASAAALPAHDPAPGTSAGHEGAAIAASVGAPAASAAPPIASPSATTAPTASASSSMVSPPPRHPRARPPVPQPAVTPPARTPPPTPAPTATANPLHL